MFYSIINSSSTQASPDKFGGVSSYSSCLFGKGIVVHVNRHSDEENCIYGTILPAQFTGLTDFGGEVGRKRTNW